MKSLMHLLFEVSDSMAFRKAFRDRCLANQTTGNAICLSLLMGKGHLLIIHLGCQTIPQRLLFRVQPVNYE